MYTALILAAGKGTRAALPTNKTNVLLDHKPVFKHSVDTFLEMGFKVILVINKNDEDYIKKWVNNVTYVYGGRTRSDSVENGLKHVTSKYVYIHDGARPFVNGEMIKSIKQLLSKHNAVLTCKNVTNTVYDKDLNTIDRQSLIQAETPQAFLTEKIKEAYAQKGDKKYTDDVSVFKDLYKNEIGLYNHYFNNDKITTIKDVNMYLKPNFKIGHSFDIHQTTKKRKLILGGVEIESNFGLLGHSDADVLLHVIAESLLGALGLGDLGTHFPDTDIKNKGLDSSEIVKYTLEQVVKEGYVIENIDATVYLEKPKLNPHIKTIKENISKMLNITEQQLNIKASTYEKQDSIGKQKAIAAEAICLLKKKD